LPQLIEQPCVIPPAGQNPKLIEEYSGRVATKTDAVSIARIVCPPGWMEVGQCPKFTETKVILKGMLQVEHTDGVMFVRAGQAVICNPGEWVKYSACRIEGAEYVTVCVPAFSPVTVHRDKE
jgi:mannose-6-phosphate isomerase-like protein (cupin superfamily)